MNAKPEGGLKLLVANSGDDYFAYQAMCPHRKLPLCEGLYDGSVLTCHQHLWQWDIRTGAAMGLAEAPLESFPVQVEGDSLYVVAQSALNAAELFTGIWRADARGHHGARAKGANTLPAASAL